MSMRSIGIATSSDDRSEPSSCDRGTEAASVQSPLSHLIAASRRFVDYLEPAQDPETECAILDALVRPLIAILAPTDGTPSPCEKLLDRADKANLVPFRMVLRDGTESGPTNHLRGTILAGSVRIGDTIVLARRGQVARISSISQGGEDVAEALAGTSLVTLALDVACDAAAGDMVAAAASRPMLAAEFAARLVWVGDKPIEPDRQYVLRIATRSVPTVVTDITYVAVPGGSGHVLTQPLAKGDTGTCNFATKEAIEFDCYAESPATGSFLVVDREHGRIVGAGLIEAPLRRSSNIQIQHTLIDKATRAALKGQRPIVLWFTGLPGAGKTTIANRVEQRVVEQGRHTCLLDGDNLRHGLNKDLGFLTADRVENMRRVGEVAKLMLEAGLTRISHHSGFGSIVRGVAGAMGWQDDAGRAASSPPRDWRPVVALIVLLLLAS